MIDPQRRPGCARRRVAALALAACAAGAPATAWAQRAGPSIPVEVFAGRLDFASDFRLAEQDLVGVRLGMDVARYAGIRGFYWRGVNGSHDEVAPIQAFGGEAQLNLNAGNGVNPFVVGGLGRLDFLDDFRDLDDELPEDRSFGIVGGGLRLDVWRLGVELAARSYLLETEAPDTDTEDLKSNLLLTAGVSFRIGRGRPQQPRPVAVPAADRVAAVRGDTVYVVRGDTLRGERSVTIPIPREGELYVRYGPVDTLSLLRREGDTLRARPRPAGAAADVGELSRLVMADLEPRIRELLRQDREETRALIRDELRRMGVGAALTPEAEQRLLENLEARLALRLRGELGQPAIVVVPDSGAPRLVPLPAPPPEEPGFEPRLQSTRVYAGMAVDYPRQGVVGGRLDLGPLSPRRPELRVLPEAGLGVGQGGHSLLVAGNLQYEVPELAAGRFRFSPYAYGGLGVLFMGDPPRGRADQEAVVNLGYGISTRIPNLGPRERFFVEHQGVDLFDLNRVLVGVRF